MCGRLDAETRTELDAIITEMHAAADANDVGKFRELDFTFHKAVVLASGNIYLPRLWDTLEPSLRSMHVLSDPGYEGDWHEVADTHRGLIEALDGSDSEIAAELFTNHAIGLAVNPEHPVGPALARVITEIENLAKDGEESPALA